MDGNVLFGILVIILFALLLLQYLLKPWFKRLEAEKHVTEKAKQDLIDERAANRVAERFKKKGHL